MLEKGLSARSAATVAAGNTAAAMGSGDLAVFATPAMVALMENAAMTAVAGELPEGATTVGAEMNVTHIKPSGLGAEITATAVLAEVEGRKLTFNVVKPIHPKEEIQIVIKRYLEKIVLHFYKKEEGIS